LSPVYRVLRRKYAGSPFDGEGAYRYGGRWSSAGVRLSYASEHQSLAMLEYSVHLDKDDPPEDLVLAVAEIPDEPSREQVRVTTCPSIGAMLQRPLNSCDLGMNSHKERSVVSCSCHPFLPRTKTIA
jgi:RES domain-containing protein